MSKDKVARDFIYICVYQRLSVVKKFLPSCPSMIKYKGTAGRSCPGPGDRHKAQVAVPCCVVARTVVWSLKTAFC